MADVKRQAGPKKRAWHLVVLGGVGLSFALAAITIDVINNHAYGAAQSPIIANAMVLFALGLAVIPTIAAFEGWTLTRRLLVALCFAITAFCALQAYTARQADKIHGAEKQQSIYTNAQADIADARKAAAEARAEAARITETSTPAELQGLVTEAAAKAEREAGRVKCGPVCEAAKADHAALIARLGQAKAKAQALARAEKADGRLSAAQSVVANGGGPAEASMIASLIAGENGGDASMIARQADLILSLLLIMGTLLFATLVHPSVTLIIRGLRGDAAKAKPAPVPAPRGLQVMPVARVVAAVKTITAAPAVLAEQSGAGQGTMEALPAPSVAVVPAQDAQQAPQDSASRGQQVPLAGKRKPGAGRKPISVDERLTRFAAECIRQGEGTTRASYVYGALEQWWRRNGSGHAIPTKRGLAAFLVAQGIASEKRGGDMWYPVKLHHPAPQLVHSAEPVTAAKDDATGIAPVRRTGTAAAE